MSRKGYLTILPLPSLPDKNRIVQTYNNSKDSLALLCAVKVKTSPQVSNAYSLSTMIISIL